VQVLLPESTTRPCTPRARGVERRWSGRGDLAQRALGSIGVRSSSPSRWPVAVAVALAAAPVAAERVSAQVTREFQAGVDAFRLGKYDDARGHLAKAAALDAKLPGPHRFLAAVAKAQARWAECVTEAREALRKNPHSQEIADTRKLHDECRAADGRPSYRGELGESAALAVSANVSGATVRVAGLRYGGTPLEPRLVKAGAAVQLDVDKLGYKPARLAIDLLPGVVTDVAVELAPADPAPPPPK
jgi:tetratricopeptide (TPR) repeat protein